jgi:hypothetical protein
MLCAITMMAAAGWLVWNHAIDSLIVLDAERTLTLVIFLLANAVVLFAAAQPARFLNRPLDARAAVITAAAAGINVGAAAFFLINAALGSLVLSDAKAPVWLIALFAPAAAALLVFVTSFGASPEGGEDISDEDIAEAALLLTESQRRWSWTAVFEMAGIMALTRTIILVIYFAWLVAGMAMFEWLCKAFVETLPLGGETLRATGAAAITHAGEILAQGWIWIVFVLVAVIPPLMILSAAVWYRVSMRRGRTRVRAISQSAAARLMTRGELRHLRRQIERPLLAEMKQQRAVS